HSQHRVVAVHRHLVPPPPPLRAHLHPPHPLQPLEVPRVHQQLVLLQHPSLHPPPQLLSTHLPSALLQRRLVRPLQRQAPHVTHEHLPSLSHRPQRSPQHTLQVLPVREVLHHRVDQHQVELPLSHPPVVVRLPLPQLHTPQPSLLQPSAQRSQALPREVRPHVPLALPRQPVRQQPRPAPHLQHPPRPQRPHTLHRPLHPLPHLLLPQRLSRVAAPPSRHVERPVPNLLLQRRLEHPPPLLHLLRSP